MNTTEKTHKHISLRQDLYLYKRLKIMSAVTGQTMTEIINRGTLKELEAWESEKERNDFHDDKHV